MASFNCCKTETESNSRENKNRSTKKYKYNKEIIRFDLGDNEFRDEYVYIGGGDTIGYQQIYHKNNIIDTSKSSFYKLDINKVAPRKYIGFLTYYYDSIDDGKLTQLSFHLMNTINGKTTRKTFETENRNSLKLEFENDNDTIVGILSVYNSKESKEKGKVRLRQRYFPVDNYNKTNNPFVELKPEW